MIERIWRGWTTPENADRYEQLLKTEVLPGIAAKNIAGYKGVQVLRRVGPDEIEFVTIMSFESLDDVKAFVGEDFERAHVPTAARQLLERFDERSQHYDIRASFTY